MLTLFNREVYKAITLGLFGYLALMHYYSQAFVWSAGSPLRRYSVLSFKLSYFKHNKRCHWLRLICHALT